MAKKKRRYRKGMELFHEQTKQVIIFGGWTDNGEASCIDKKQKTFLTIPRDEIDNTYIAYSELEREAKARRRGQAW